MKNEIKTTCPRCKRKTTAYYYPALHKIGCVVCGWLLYTETPEKLKKTYNKTLNLTEGKAPSAS